MHYRIPTLIAFCALISTFATAQSIGIYPSPIVYVDGAPTDNTITAVAHIQNNGTAATDITWVRENVNIPTGWKTSVCDLNACWSSSLSTETFTIEPTIAGGIGEVMDVQFKPFGVAGIGQIDIAFYRAGTTTLLVRNTYNCSAQFVGTAQVEQTTARISPNPATHYINISHNDNIASATVVSAIGAVVRNFVVSGETAHLDVSDLETGVYFLQLKTQTNAVLSTVKILKN